MDPKSAQISDPKLKEAYDRVMGMSLPKATHNTEPPKVAEKPMDTPLPTPPTQQPHDPLMATAHEQAAPPANHASPTTAPAPTPAHASMSFSTAYVAPHEDKKSPISAPLLLFAGVIFLIVYTLFWMKWFGMTLPFLP